MAQETLTPSGAGTYCGFSHQSNCNACGVDGHFDCIDAQDSRGAYTHNQAAMQTDSWHVDNHSVGSGTINWVRFYVLMGALGLGIASTLTHDILVRTRGSNYFYNKTPVADGLAWHYQQLAANPAGGAWTWAQIDAVEIGVRGNGYHVEDKIPDDMSIWADYAYVLVDYTVGWQGKISTVVNPGKIASVARAAISKVKSVVSG